MMRKILLYILAIVNFQSMSATEPFVYMIYYDLGLSSLGISYCKDKQRREGVILHKEAEEAIKAYIDNMLAKYKDPQERANICSNLIDNKKYLNKVKEITSKYCKKQGDKYAPYCFF